MDSLLSLFPPGSVRAPDGWVAVALAWCFFYGTKHSHLGRHEHVGLAAEHQP